MNLSVWIAIGLFMLISSSCSGVLPLVAAEAPAGPESQVWFAPNMGSPDMLELFTQPDQWRSAREQIDVFKFYTGNVASGRQSCKGTARCGSNYLDRFVAVDAFSKLKQWNIEIAVESLYPFPRRPQGNSYKCLQGEEAVEYAAKITAELVQNVQSHGGVVRYLAMDEPVRKWYPQAHGKDKKQPCQYDDLGKLADDVARYIKRIKTLYPSIVVGQIELYPEVGVSQLKKWIVELEKRKIFLPFLHLDVHERRISAYRKLGVAINVAEDLKTLKDFLQAHNIAFGVIFTDPKWQIYKPSNYNDKVYYDNTVGWIRAVQKAIGEPDHSIFQSWVISFTDRTFQKIPRQELSVELEKRTQKIPANLPENNPSAYSHTRLIQEGLRILRKNGEPVQ